MFAAACSNNDKKNDAVREYTLPIEFNTAEPWEWEYISLGDGTLVTENDDWDIAVLKYRAAEMAIKMPSDTEERPISYMVTGQGRPSIGEKNIVWSGLEAVDFAFDVMPPQYVLLPPRTFGDYEVQFFYDGEEFKIEVR